MDINKCVDRKMVIDEFVDLFSELVVVDCEIHIAEYVDCEIDIDPCVDCDTDINTHLAFNSEDSLCMQQNVYHITGQ
jgi:hypothetical protein